MVDSEKNQNDIQEVYLMTVSGGIELDIVEGILRCEGIPFIKKYLGAGGVAQTFHGFFNAGIDVEIYVSSEDLQRAKDTVQKTDEAAKNEGKDIE